MTEGLKIWTVYKRPLDFPNYYVVRCWIGDQPTNHVLLGRDLNDVRSLLPEGLFRMDRHEDDDPCIVETWF